MTRIWRTLAAILAYVVLAQPAAAHPHSWIDLRSTVVLDDQGAVTAIQVDWVFDEFYSTFVIEDIVRAGENIDTALQVLTQDNLKGLRDFNYFTEIHADGKPVAFSDATDGSMRVFKDRLRMTFTIPLTEPVDPRKVLLEYAVYDPTYYIEILHLNEGAITVADPTDGACSATLDTPTPDASWVSLAASLDQTAIAPDNLGKLFAEVVTVSCAR